MVSVRSFYDGCSLWKLYVASSSQTMHGRWSCPDVWIISDDGHAVRVPTSAVITFFASDNFSLFSKQPATVHVQLVTFWGATQKLFFLLTSVATFCRHTSRIWTPSNAQCVRADSIYSGTKVLFSFQKVLTFGVRSNAFWDIWQKPDFTV